MNFEYTFLGYSLTCGVILIVAAIFYNILCKDKLFPSTNRRIILYVYLLMFTMPIVAALFPISIESKDILIGLPEAMGIQKTGTIIELVSPNFFMDKIQSILTYSYLAGILVMIVNTASNIFYLYALKRNSEKITVEGKKVYLHSDSSLGTFSWLKDIYLYNGTERWSNETQLHLLIQHEEAHINKYHWLDLILTRVVIIFQWFNPAAWFFRNELQRVHEYEADREILRQGNDAGMYQRLLINNISVFRTSGLTDGLNNCSLKSRIIMMNNKNIPKHRGLRVITVGLLAIAGGFIIHFPAVGAFLGSNENALTINSLSSSSDSHSIKNEDQTLPTIAVTTKLRENDSDVFTTADKMPCFEGGERALMAAIAENINYPQSEMGNQAGATVVLQFVVNTDGTMGDFKIVQSQGEAFDNAALTAVRSVKGKWEPGMNGGIPVRVVYTLPIRFSTKS